MHFRVSIPLGELEDPLGALVIYLDVMDLTCFPTCFPCRQKCASGSMCITCRGVCSLGLAVSGGCRITLGLVAWLFSGAVWTWGSMLNKVLFVLRAFSEEGEMSPAQPPWRFFTPHLTPLLCEHSPIASFHLHTFHIHSEALCMCRCFRVCVHAEESSVQLRIQYMSLYQMSMCVLYQTQT